MDAHLLADQVDHRREAILDALSSTEKIDRDRCLVTVGDCPDDILWSKGSVTTKEDLGVGRLHRDRIDHRHIPLVELETDIPLDPGEGVLLTYRDDGVIALDV